VLSPEDRLRLDAQHIWALLKQNDWYTAGELLHRYPMELLNQDNTLLHFLYGCWLHTTEGKEISRIHFAGTLEVSFPRTWALVHHYLMGKLDADGEWSEEAFLFEKRELFWQLALYYHCIGDESVSRDYERRANAAVIDPLED
jgi:hypothetical protein